MYNYNMIPNTFKNSYEFITFNGEEPYNFHLLSIDEQIKICYPYGTENGQIITPVIHRIDTIIVTDNVILDIYGSYKNVWFYGQDIAYMLDYSILKGKKHTRDVHSIIQRLKPYMRLKFICPDLMTQEHKNPYRLFINELGLYQLLFRSRKPEAEYILYSLFNTINNNRIQSNSYTISNINNTTYK